MGVRYVTCTCAEMGCNKKRFELDGVIWDGVRMSAMAYQNHVRAIGGLSASTTKTSPDPSPPINRAQPVSSGTSRNLVPHDRPQVETRFWRVPEFKFITTHTLIVLLQAAAHSLFDGTSDRAVNSSLKVENEKWKALRRSQLMAGSSETHEQIPSTIATVFKRLHLHPAIRNTTCCPECFTLYPRNGEYVRTTPRKCDADFLSESKTYVKRVLNGSPDKCNQPLFQNSKSEDARKPLKTFSYQTMVNWLSRMMSLPGFEDLLDSPLTKPAWSPEAPKSDIWDGSVWNTLKISPSSNVNYTSQSGNLVFSLYLDWFNPYKSQRKTGTIGAIVLICLNLPPSKRYLEENIFLYAVMPGPNEPSLDQINHLLQPLINELEIFWKGVWFDQTFREPEGRMIKAAIFPLIADLPALRKAAGFSGHSSRLFCSFCSINKKNINSLDSTDFIPRTNELHLELARKWEELKTYAERDQFVKLHGVRFSILNRLEYWRPVDFCAIEIMHNLILGNLKDHATTYLSISTAGSILEGKLKKHKNWKITRKRIVFQLLEPEYETVSIADSLSQASDNDSHPESSSASSVTPRSKASRYSARLNVNQTGRGSSSQPGPPSRKRKNMSDIPDEATQACPNSPTEATTKRSRVAVNNEVPKPGPSRYNLRSRRKPAAIAQSRPTPNPPKDPPLPKAASETTSRSYSCPSKSCGKNQNTPCGKKQNTLDSDLSMDEQSLQSIELHQDSEGSTPKATRTRQLDIPAERNNPQLLPWELEALHVAIDQTLIPSWISRVPKLVGLPGNRSLKAAEWLILYLVYIPMTLVPLWCLGTENKDRKILLETTTELVAIANILTSRSISSHQVDLFSNSLINYRRLLIEGWKGIASKPNIHISHHYPESISRFGPPSAIASWNQERLNGVLAKIPTNNHLSLFNTTICERWNMKAQLISLVKHAARIKKIPAAVANFIGRMPCSPSGQPARLDGPTYSRWFKFLAANQSVFGPRGGVWSVWNSQEPDEHAPKLLLEICNFGTVHIHNKRYTTRDQHAGNSTVQVKYRDLVSYGQIEKIFTSSQIEDKKFFQIQLFQELEPEISNLNPYKNYPLLNCHLVYSQTSDVVVVEASWILGHAAILTNPPGTFAIDRETCSMAGLGDLGHLISETVEDADDVMMS